MLDATDEQRGPNGEYYRDTLEFFGKVGRRFVFSQFMEIELACVLRHMGAQQQDELWSEYLRLKSAYGATRGGWIKTHKNQQILFEYCEQKRRIIRRSCSRRCACGKKPNKRLTVPDLAHIGICGLADVENIVSNDHYLIGIDKRTRRHWCRVVRDFLCRRVCDLLGRRLIKNPLDALPTRKRASVTCPKATKLQNIIVKK